MFAVTILAAAVFVAWIQLQEKSPSGQNFDLNDGLNESLDLMNNSKNYPPKGSISPEVEEANLSAFLDAIAKAEGTLNKGQHDGYGILFGYPAAGREFDPTAAGDHPRIFFPYTDKVGKTLRTSAAGRYQITATTYDDFIRRGKVSAGFDPEDQDIFAEAILANDGALEHVKAGRLQAATDIAKRRWASLPNAGVNQPERSYAYFKSAYENAGGTIA